MKISLCFLGFFLSKLASAGTVTNDVSAEREMTASSCDGVCEGEFPYGCAENLDWPFKFMCAAGNICYYSYTDSDPGPYDDNSGFCTYKTQTPTNPRERPTRGCRGYCEGEYPFGCADRLDWPYKFMCAPGRICYYSYSAEDQGPYDDNSIFCTYKTQRPTNPRERPTRPTPTPPKTDCDEYCPGVFPYGCADNIDGVVKYMCLPQGGCYYARDASDDGPYDDNSAFCVYLDKSIGVGR